MSTIDARREQMFPKLEPREIDRLRRFGTVRRYAPGEALFVTGEIAPGMSVLIKGSVRVTRRDPLGHSAPILEQGPGEFVAEVGQLSGQPAFVDVHAIDDVEALLIPSENLRALMIEGPELGEHHAGTEARSHPGANCLGRVSVQSRSKRYLRLFNRRV